MHVFHEINTLISSIGKLLIYYCLCIINILFSFCVMFLNEYDYQPDKSGSKTIKIVGT